MPKKSEKSSFVTGYNTWSRRRTIDEAKILLDGLPGLRMSGWQSLFKERLLRNLIF